MLLLFDCLLRFDALMLWCFCVFLRRPNARAVRRVLHLAKVVYVGWLCPAGTRAGVASPFCAMQRLCRKICGGDDGAGETGDTDDTGGAGGTGKAREAGETDDTFATSTAA